MVKLLRLKLMLLLCALVAASGSVWAAEEEVFNVPCSSTPDGWTLSNGAQQSGYWLFAASSGLGDHVITKSYDLSVYTSVTITAQVATYGNGSNYPKAKIEISYDGGTTYSETTTQGSPTSNSYVNISYTLLSKSNNVVIRVSNSISSGRGLRFKNFVMKGTKPDTKETTLSLNKTTLNLEANGDIETLTATVTPTGEAALDNPTIRWTTGNSSVATVENGTVTSVGEGTTTITAYFDGDATYSASSNTCTVSVQDSRLPVNITGFTATNSTLVVGNTTATTVLNDQPDWTPVYTYSSSNTNVAAVDANGVISAVAKGTAEITVNLNVAASDVIYKVGTNSSWGLVVTVNNTAHAVQFSVNGSIANDKTQMVEEGESITLPTDIADIEGKSFVGWVENDFSGTTDKAPDFVTSATMGTTALTFYAVFAEKTPGSAITKTDVLSQSITGVTGTGYETFSNKKADDGSNAVYAGQCAGSVGSIQLRTANSNSGIITTTSGGKIKKVTVTWHGNTSNGRTLDIYGRNTAYSAATDLYDSSLQGSLLGSIVKGTSTELTITGDYTFVGLRSHSDPMYLTTISIDWLDGTPDTYSGYCTTVAPDTRTAVNMTSFAITPATTTLIRDEIYTTAVTNNQSGWTAAYTYTSDNTDVADVDEDGNIYAYAKGTAKITATLNVNKNDENYKVGETKSMSIDITVENPKHTVAFYNNGTKLSETEVEEEVDIEFPTDPTAPIADYEFIGWATAAIDGSVATAPTTVTSATMGTANINYYAVFADVQRQTATFDASDITNLDKDDDYRMWTEKTTGFVLSLSGGQHYTSGTPYTFTVTKGTSNYFEVEVEGKLISVVTTISGTSYKINRVSTGSLSTSGTTQTVTFTSNATSVRCYATGDYQIRATKIVVNADVVMGYYTTVPTTVGVSISSANYATFSNGHATNFSDTGIKAYKAKVDGNVVKLTEIANGVVPANTGVILYKDGGTTSPVAVPFTTTTATVSDNELVAAVTRTFVAKTGGNGYNYIMQSDGNGGIVFYMAAVDGAYLAAGKAYLSTTVDASADAARLNVLFDDVTGIDAVMTEGVNNKVFDLQGRCVAQPTKGLYIMNGKKVIIK